VADKQSRARKRAVAGPARIGQEAEKSPKPRFLAIQDRRIEGQV